MMIIVLDKNNALVGWMSNIFCSIDDFMQFPGTFGIRVILNFWNNLIRISGNNKNPPKMVAFYAR